METLLIPRLTDDMRRNLVAAVSTRLGPGWWDQDPDVEPEPPSTQHARLEFLEHAGGAIA